jgi:hypothetical protein
MVAPKYGHRDSQVNMGGRVYSSAESSPPKDAWRETSATRNNTSSRSNLKWMASSPCFGAVPSESRLTRQLQLIGGIALFGFLGAGTAVALVLFKKNAPASSSSVSPGSSTLSNSDPSSFAKDPALAQSFYGIAYTPEGSQMPNCGNSLGKQFR